MSENSEKEVLKRKKTLQEYTVNDILSEDPLILTELFSAEYAFPIPETIDSVEDLQEAGRLLGQLTNIYSYLAQLSVYAKISVRMTKRDKKTKDEIDSAIDRKAVIDTFLDTVGMRYKAVSRMLTVKQQINEELKMSLN